MTVHHIGSIKGTHSIGDLVGIKNPKKFDNIEIMQKILHGAARKAKLNVLGENWEKFQPQGLSGFLFLSESHISVHFSPEHRSAWIDSFTCSGGDGSKIAIEHIVKSLKPDLAKSRITHLDRSFII